MKRLTTLLITLGTLVIAAQAHLNASMVYAQSLETARYWTVNLSEPQAVQNSRTFNLDYQVSSTVKSDYYTVWLYQDKDTDELIGIPQTVAANDKGGDSGRFTITVPADGTYSYYVKALNEPAGDTKISKTVTTKIVSTLPESVIYGGKTVNGNLVTIKFTVPAGSSITAVNIYGSISSSFNLNSSTLLVSVAATPGIEQTVSFINSQANNLNVAISGFDIAGNRSLPTGDAQINFIDDSTASTLTTAASSGALGGTDATDGIKTADKTDESVTEVAGSKTAGGMATWLKTTLIVLGVAAGIVAMWYIYSRYAVDKEK